jgi:hypothetical protein
LAAITTKRLVRLALGIALSGGALWLALRRTSAEEIGDAFSHAQWEWIPAMIGLKVLVLMIKDWRWRIELEAMQPGPYQKTFRAIGLGYFGNLVLPFKLGELLRVGLLKRHNPTTGLGDALATVAAERAIDGAILAIMVGSVLPFAEVPSWVMRGTIILLVVMLGVIAVSMLERVHVFAKRLFPETGWLRMGRKIIDALSTGTRVLRKPKPFAMAAVLTGLAWFGESLVLYCGMQALDLDLAYSTALIVTLLMSVGLLIPSAPGQIGTHQALAVLFLEPFGVASGVAVTVSLLQQAVALTTLGSIGGYVLVREAGARDLIGETDEETDD